LRLTTLIIALVDTAIFLFAASVTLFSGSDAATRGLDNAAGWGIVALFAITVAPALVLLWRGKAPRTALALVLAPPLVIVAALAVIVATLP
jgi:hypothetical protein